MSQSQYAGLVPASIHIWRYRWPDIPHRPDANNRNQVTSGSGWNPYRSGNIPEIKRTLESRPLLKWSQMLLRFCTCSSLRISCLFWNKSHTEEWYYIFCQTEKLPPPDSVAQREPWSQCCQSVIKCAFNHITFAIKPLSYHKQDAGTRQKNHKRNWFCNTRRQRVTNFGRHETPMLGLKTHKHNIVWIKSSDQDKIQTKSVFKLKPGPRFFLKQSCPSMRLSAAAYFTLAQVCWGTLPTHCTSHIFSSGTTP